MKSDYSNKSIYDLKLHEQTFINEIEEKVIRVPGGWIYKLFHNNVFVPFVRTDECCEKKDPERKDIEKHMDGNYKDCYFPKDDMYYLSKSDIVDIVKHFRK